MFPKPVAWFLENVIPKEAQPTWFLRLFGLAAVRMIWWVRPRVLQLSDEVAEVVIPLNGRTRNHLRSMYFGTLAVGADCAGGILAVAYLYRNNLPVSFVFKDFKAEFLKRPDGDVHFFCDLGASLREAVDETMRTGERVNIPTPVIATVPSKHGDEPVAKFQLTLSLKKITRKT